ncbi:MAG: MliC family protein [Candidatus Pacebacteria bacterium]|nr:MliC family protein [Candidatus Paceibacterota bacterium]
MKKTLITIIVIVLVIVGVGAWFVSERQKKGSDTVNQAGNQSIGQGYVLISQVNYVCDEDKTIEADYYEGPEAPAPQPGEPPTPRGRVEISLSDGRQMTLPQTISASGIRYANSDESVIFWSKGQGAFIVENEVQTYSECVSTP